MSKARSHELRRSNRSNNRHGYTLLEVFLVLVITGVLVAAIASALNIHLRVAEVGRTEVEQAQLARALLRRIADDLRGAVPHIEPVASSAGATADEIASAVASASSALGGTGSTGGSISSGSAGSGATGGSSSRGSSTGSSGSSSSGGSGSSGVQTPQTLTTLKTLETLKPLSAKSSTASGSGAAAGASSAGSSGKSSSGSSTADSSTADTDEAETSTIKPPGIYGDQFSLQVDVSRLPRASGSTMPGAAADAPGDVKTIGYFLMPIAPTNGAAGTSATGATNNLGLFRQSSDRAVASYGATTGGAAGSGDAQFLATEVAALEFRYYDGAQWQTTWDSSGGTLPTAVEVLLTLEAPTTQAVSSSASLTLPQTYRLVVAIPAAKAATATSTTESDATTSSSSSETAK